MHKLCVQRFHSQRNFYTINFVVPKIDFIISLKLNPNEKLVNLYENI